MLLAAVAESVQARRTWQRNAGSQSSSRRSRRRHFNRANSGGIAICRPTKLELVTTWELVGRSAALSRPRSLHLPTRLPNGTTEIHSRFDVASDPQAVPRMSGCDPLRTWVRADGFFAAGVGVLL
jgi:hypothetical protein